MDREIKILFPAWVHAMATREWSRFVPKEMAKHIKTMPKSCFNQQRPTKDF